MKAVSRSTLSLQISYTCDLCYKITVITFSYDTGYGFCITINSMAAAAILNFIGSSNVCHLYSRMTSYIYVLNLIEISISTNVRCQTVQRRAPSRYMLMKIT